MRITAKDILGQFNQNIELPVDQLEHVPMFRDMYEGIAPPTRTKLEHDYVVNGLDFGDHMRMVSPRGDLVDVILMPDGRIGVQEINTKVEYGPVKTFNEWEDAEEQLSDWTFYKAIQAKKRFTATDFEL